MVFALSLSFSAFAQGNTAKKVVRVGYVNVATYEEGGEGEYKTGSGYEYLQKISYFTGWKYQYVYGSFKELYDMLVEGEIDLFGDVSYTEERSKLFFFSTYPQGKDVYFLYTTKDRTDLLSGNVRRLQGTRIGVTQGSYQETLLREWLANNNIDAKIQMYDGYEALMADLDGGNLDVIATPKLSSGDYHYGAIIDIGFDDYYFAVSKSRPDLLSELNEALYQIQSGDPNYNATLESRYQVSMISDTFISEREKAWLAKHNNTIRLGYLDDNLPYSACDLEGNLVGVLQALVESMEHHFCVTVETTSYSVNTEMMDALVAGDLDAIGPLYSDYWLAEQNNLIQTNVILSTTPVLFYGKKKNEESPTHVIAVSDPGFLRPDVIKIMVPDSEVVVYNGVENCLNAVKNGKASGMVVAASQINLVKRYRVADQLQVAEIPGQIEICIGTTKGNPELANIFNKGITTAGNGLSGAVLSQNSYVKQDVTFRDFVEEHLAVIAVVASGVITALLLVVMYMIRMTMQIREANKEITKKQEELQKALKEAERANSAKTTFLANMSHDIRTPINGIMGMIEIIEKNPDNPQKRQECLKKIRASSDHLLQLINDILDLSRLESGQIVLEHVPFNLRQVGEDTVTVVEGQAKEAGVQTICEHMDGSDIWLIGSPLHYKQIMLNLYTNAIKYNKPGGLLYTNLEEYSRTDDVLTLKITVRDTGIGMTQEFIDTKLFSPFIQGESGPRTKFKGIGLGMSIVKAIVEEMNGSIHVESKVGEGTTFTVFLPFEIDHSSHKEPEKEKEVQADITGISVLLVEDNDLNMEIAQFLLEDAGAVVTKAENGKIAVEKFASSAVGEFDLILMDIMMPVMDGLSATKAIRAMDRADAKTIPIFAMTANAFSEDEQKSIDAGMNEHVAKPLESEKLIALIAKYVVLK